MAGSVILASRQYPQGGGTGIDKYGAASPRFMGDLIWIGMSRGDWFGYGWLDCVLRVQSVTWVGVLISPSAPVSGTGTGFDSSPIKGRGMEVGVVLLYASPCGYCLKASTILRHGRIQQVLSVSCHHPSGLTSLRSRCASVRACSAEELCSSSFSSR